MTLKLSFWFFQQEIAYNLFNSLMNQVFIFYFAFI
jgi:hypothetical protein